VLTGIEEEIADAVAAHRDVAECSAMRALGELLRRKGEYNRALPLYEKCLAKRKRILGDDHPDTLSTLIERAVVFDRKGDYDCALPLYEECLEKRRKILGDDHPNTLSTLNGLAFTLFLKGECARALPLLEECLVQAKAILGNSHDWTILYRTRRDNCAWKLADE
jgi:tetratricopeptide (TPR) repeat protein